MLGFTHARPSKQEPSPIRVRCGLSLGSSGLSRGTRLHAFVLALAVLAVIVACGGDEAPVAGDTSQQQTSDLPNLAAATAEVERHTAIPQFDPPGPAFDASGARGKTAVVVPVTSAIPFVQEMSVGFQEAMRLAGVTATDFPTSGSQADIINGFNLAIARNVDLILALGIDPATIEPQVAAANRAGIKVLLGHQHPETGFELPEGFVAETLAPFYQAAKLISDYTIMDSRGEANALAVTANEQLSSPGMADVYREEFRTKCGPGCRLQFVNVPVPQWATRMQTEVQSALVRDPSIDYVMPIYDGMLQFIVPAITAAGRTGSVKAVSFNGTPFALKMIQDGDTVIADIGENTRWLGWSMADQALRILSGEPPIESGNVKTPTRVFDDSNIDEAGRPPQSGKGYGDAYVSAYKELWGLS